MAALEDPQGGIKASPQRSEALVVERAADETARALVDLLLGFMCRLYLRTHSSLRDETPAWSQAVAGLLQRNEMACRMLNCKLAAFRAWPLQFLIRCPHDGPRQVTHRARARDKAHGRARPTPGKFPVVAL